MKRCIPLIQFVRFAASMLLAAVCSCCSLDEEIVSQWGMDVSCPHLVSLSPADETCVKADFTQPVRVVASSLRTDIEDGPDLPVAPADTALSTAVSFLLPAAPGPGKKALLSATVEDARGNRLSFAVPFVGWNSRVPRLAVNEIRCVYSKPRVEFVELLVLEDGNLGGVAIENPGNAASPVWTFPSVEVSRGDFVVYHLRSIEEGLVDEVSPGLVSAGTDARADAVDFWDDQSKAPLKKTGGILVRERVDGKILDAAFWAEDGKDSWPNPGLEAAAAEAVSQGSWGPDAGIGSAVPSLGTTATRTLCRDRFSGGVEDTDSAADWRVCATGKSSAGAENIPWQ